MFVESIRPFILRQGIGIFDDVESATFGKVKHEINANDLGNEIVNRLQMLDEVAYVRFASVYRQFKDINQFISEIKTILEKGKSKETG